MVCIVPPRSTDGADGSPPERMPPVTRQKGSKHAYRGMRREVPGGTLVLRGLRYGGPAQAQQAKGVGHAVCLPLLAPLGFRARWVAETVLVARARHRRRANGDWARGASSPESRRRPGAGRLVSTRARTATCVMDPRCFPSVPPLWRRVRSCAAAARERQSASGPERQSKDGWMTLIPTKTT